MIVYGKNVIKEAVLAKRKIYKLYIDQKLKDRDFLNFLEEKKIYYKEVDKGFLNNLAANSNHQGVVADVRPYEYKELDDVIDKTKRQRFLILDGLEDPHNLGAILRTSEATKVDGIIIGKKNQVLLNATVAKVSSGAIEHVDVILVNNIVAAIKKLKEENIWIVGTSDKASINYQSIAKDISVAIILGNEGEGIRPLVKNNCDILVKIPMYGKVNSLNVSVAAALMLYATL